MEITGSSIVGYAYGLISLLVGLVAVLFGFLFLAAGTGGGVWVVFFGVVLLVGAIVAMPITRRWLSGAANIDFSRGAVVAINGAVAIVATILFVVAIIGLIGSAPASAPGDDVSNVSVSANDASGTASNSLAITWNTRAQSGVDPDTSDLSSYSAEDGQKFVVLRMQLENTGSEDIELTPRFFKLESDGVVYDYQGLFGSSNGVSGVTLQPGATYDGWIAFQIPEDKRQATLIVDQSAYFNEEVNVEFIQDEELPIGVSD